MLLGDVRLLTPAKLERAAEFYGLAPRGKKQLWVMRKSVTDPVSGIERPLKRSTKTTDLRTAVMRAATWWEEHVGQVQRHRLPSLVKASAWASLGEIRTAYFRAATCDLATRRSNWNCLVSILAEMSPDQATESISTEQLDGRFIRQWQQRMKELAEKAHLPKDVEACERAKRGANHKYRKARSVFSRSIRRAYEDAGLRLPPALADFATQGFLKTAPPPPSEQLSPEVAGKIWRLMPRLKEVRPAIWACVLLMWRAGLRNKEAYHARWSWVIRRADGTGYALDLRTRGDFTSKTRSDDIVEIDPALIAELESVRRPAERDVPEAFIIPAETDEARRRACYRGISKFLRACGVTEHKGKFAYRLRGDAITETWLKHGARAAQALARHKSPKTTEIYRGARVPYTPLAMPGGITPSLPTPASDPDPMPSAAAIPAAPAMS